MRVQINGRAVELAAGANVADAVDHIGSPRRGVAVAVDGTVVPRGSWADRTLGEGATVEVVSAVQGG